MPVNDTIGVTGMGIVSSIGDDIKSFGSSLKKGKSGITKVNLSSNPVISVNIAAKVPDFSFVESLKKFQNIPDEISKKARQLGQRAPFVIQTSIISALQAWEQARLFENAPAPHRIGIIVAGQNSTQNYQYNLASKFRDNPEYLSPRYALEFLETNQIGVLSELFSIHGEGTVIGGASATGNVGIIKAHQLVEAGIVDVCLLIGVLADLSPIDIQGFINIGAMGGKTYGDQPEKACRPFDSSHEGFIYGQASAALIVETSESARKRSVPLQAKLGGGIITLDANNSANPNKTGEYNAMKFALEKSGLTINDIDYINTHGSSSPLGDKTEAQAISDLLGQSISKVWINATKGLTGHCLYSAGMVEAVATIIQMKEGFVHPNKNLEEPVSKLLNFTGDKSVDYQPSIALSNSFGFGGINTSIVLKRA